MQTSKDAIYLARHIGLKSNIHQNTPALTINRLCGSGFEAIICGARQLLLNESKCVLVGGTESMSQSPHIIRGARWGLNLAKCNLEDSLWTSLTDSYINLSMAITVEMLAEQYKITQNEVDLFSLNSQHKFSLAQKKGLFDNEIIPINMIKNKKHITFKLDEHPRPKTTLKELKKLPKVFKKNGLIHAGAASGICDGAAALIICSNNFIKNTNIKPIGKLISFGISGCNPSKMGIGPVSAIKIALKKAKMILDDIDLIEINEAFAPQILAVKKELKIPEAKLNINGGAIAIGHPLAASGARIITHLLYSLKNKSKQLGLGAACIGGGQGISLIIESC
jgi:acetyl-CoA acyltransferase 2